MSSIVIVILIYHVVLMLVNKMNVNLFSFPLVFLKDFAFLQGIRKHSFRIIDTVLSVLCF
jgi:hypothetical protein